MNREHVIETLRRNELDLRARGVLHAALFGSIARGDQKADSDIDILIDVEPERIRDVYSYVGLKSFIAGLFGGPVDVIDREGLPPGLRGPAEREALYAF